MKRVNLIPPIMVVLAGGLAALFAAEVIDSTAYKAEFTKACQAKKANYALLEAMPAKVITIKDNEGKVTQVLAAKISSKETGSPFPWIKRDCYISSPS